MRDRPVLGIRDFGLCGLRMVSGPRWGVGVQVRGSLSFKSDGLVYLACFDCVLQFFPNFERYKHHSVEG